MLDGNVTRIIRLCRVQRVYKKFLTQVLELQESIHLDATSYADISALKR